MFQKGHGAGRNIIEKSKCKKAKETMEIIRPWRILQILFEVLVHGDSF
jgi:hypothetical protein